MKTQWLANDVLGDAVNSLLSGLNYIIAILLGNRKYIEK